MTADSLSPVRLSDQDLEKQLLSDRSHVKSDLFSFFLGLGLCILILGLLTQWNFTILLTDREVTFGVSLISILVGIFLVGAFRASGGLEAENAYGRIFSDYPKAVDLEAVKNEEMRINFWLAIGPIVFGLLVWIIFGMIVPILT